MAVLEQAMGELQEQGVDADSRLVHLVAAAAERELAAGGGAHVEHDAASGDRTD